MADQQIGNVHGVAASHIGDADTFTNTSGSADSQGGFNDSDLSSISTMRTRLAAAGAPYNDVAYLNLMTYNDMVYAVRLLDAPTTVR